MSPTRLITEVVRPTSLLPLMVYFLIERREARKPAWRRQRYLLTAFPERYPAESSALPSFPLSK